MLTPLSLSLLLAAASTPALPPPGDAKGQGQVTVQSHVTAGTIPGGLGDDLRPRVRTAKEKIKAGHFEEAIELLRAVDRDYQKRFEDGDPAKVFYARDEYEAWSKGRPEKIRWADWGYEQVLVLQAFVQVELGKHAKAEALLATAIDRSPTGAGVRLERGYARMKQGRMEEALADYNTAIFLTEQWASQKPWRAGALRARGFVQIERGKLRTARADFEASLTLEPGNQTARNELAYLDGLEGKAPVQRTGPGLGEVTLGPWRNETDYRRDEPKILEIIDWLLENPFAPDDQRGPLQAGVMKWTEGAPHILVSIEAPILEEVVGEDDSHPMYFTLFGSYLFALTRYAIEHGGKAGSPESVYVAIGPVLGVYASGKVRGLPSIPGAERLLALQNEGTLRQHVLKVMRKHQKGPKQAGSPSRP